MPVIFGVVGVVGVIGVVGGVATLDHSDHSKYTRYSRYSEYSDAEVRKQKEEAKRTEDLRNAKEAMTKTLQNVKTSMVKAAGDKGRLFFENWHPTANDFSFKDFEEEYNKLDAEAKKRISSASAQVFAAEEKACRDALDETNALIRRITEKKFTEK